MTKKQMQARIAELEALVASLNATVATLAARPIYVGPLPAQPTVNPTPYHPMPTPYIGDPPYPWGTTTCIGGSSNIGGLTTFCKGVIDNAATER